MGTTNTEKQAAIALIDQLPEGVSMETIVTELQFKLLIRRRAQIARGGEGLITHDEMKQRLAKWLTLPGS